VQCYMVRVMITPDFLGRSYLESYFVAGSDRCAIKNSFSHAMGLIEHYGLRVEKLEVFAYRLSTMLEGVSQGGIERMLYDSENLMDSIIQDKPSFVG
jgi:hypothetical protein